MKTYLSYTISSLKEEDSAMLAYQLQELGSLGAEELENGLLVYFDETADTQEIATCIQSFTTQFEMAALPEQNWNAQWESNFQPVAVDDFCYIRASFHPDQDGYKHSIQITPKMSFGTGHHATTYQVIQMMKLLEWQGKAVLDFGTGTGILAILAAQLGAQKIVAIDNDEWSVNNAMENIAINHTQNIEVSNTPLSQLNAQRFDIVLANINRHILLENMATISKLLNDKGQIIMSGILQEDEAIIIQEAIRQGLHLKAKSEKNNWLCLLLDKQ